MLPGGNRTICMICMIQHTFPGLDLYYADPAQPLTTATEEPDDLDHDLSMLCGDLILSVTIYAALTHYSIAGTWYNTSW